MRPSSTRPTTVLIALSVFVMSLMAMGSAQALPDGARLTLSPGAGVLMTSEWSEVNDDYYVGGGIGFMVNRHLGLEGTLGFSPTSTRTGFAPSVTVRHLGADLRYQILTTGRIRPYLNAGWAQFRYDIEGSGQKSDYDGFEFGGGLLVPLREEPTWRAMLRLDVRDMMIKFTDPRPDDGNYHHNLLASIGIQFEFGEDWHEDLDGDAVIDRYDDCLGTMEGVVVDGRGCGIDSDGDGIFDGLDACMGTPTGATIDSTGCPIDSDGDGVFDGLDACADTPAGATIDGRGCPNDADKDGVLDGLDRCPDTPRAVKVDEFGCPKIENKQEEALVETGTITLTGLKFESGKAELDPASTPDLRHVAEAMRKWPELKLEVGGHTDSRGSDTFNAKLSGERAETVRLYLVENFDWIDDSRLTAVGYGEATPVADNETEDGRAQNRRVEFKVLSGGPKQ